MDPLSALSLAGTIVQFVDFSCKLISQTRKTYKSATGLPDDVIQLQLIATDIKGMIDDLQISSSSGATSAGSLLRSFAFDCKDVAEDLLRAIEKITNDNPNSKWKSFMTALNHVLRPDQVQKITSGIANLQGQVGLQFLNLMSMQQHELAIKLGEIEDNNRRLEMARSSEFQQLKADLISAINNLQDDETLQHDNIKTHLNKISAMQDIAQIDALTLSDRMGKLQNVLKAFAAETRDIAVEQTVLDTLTYKEAQQRMDQVASAHPDTFGWIFDKPFSAGPTISQTFAEWLRSDSGLCWIIGKPGSGKSTLMKRVLRDKRTEQELRQWSKKTDHDVCIGSYFFWIGGTALQKSQEGLLRTLLYDIFRQTPKAIALVCSEMRLAASNPYRSRREAWTRSELFETFGALADRKDINKKYCFFIDGLDEYKAPEEGNYSDLVGLLQRFSTCSNFKFCVASREENEFRDLYLTVNHYILQQLTVGDIGKFVRGLLNESTHFQRLSSEDIAYLELEEEIIRRAQGVFLWVSLVMKSLIDGMRNSDTIADLRSELENLPDSLEKYFKRMIEDIEPRYRIPAAKTLQVTNQAVESLQLLTYYFLEDEGKTSKSRHGWPSLSKAEVERYHEDARRRLAVRSRGLLDIQEGTRLDHECVYFKYTVFYLHRTARDFLYETTEMQTFFERLLPSGYVAQQELCKAFLLLMEKVPLCECGCDIKGGTNSGAGFMGHDPFEKVLRNFLKYAEYMWKTRSDPQIDLLRRAEQIVLRRPKQWRQSKPTAFLGLAVQFGLTEYVRIRVEESPAILREKSRPLLEYALTTMTSESEVGGMVREFFLERNVRLEMIELLLRLGAPVERRSWCPLLRILHDARFKQRDLGYLVGALALLVKYNANLQEAIVVDYVIMRPRKSGRVSQLSKGEVRADNTTTAHEIICNSFSPAEVERILRHQPLTTAKSWLDFGKILTRKPWDAINIPGR